MGTNDEAVDLELEEEVCLTLAIDADTAVKGFRDGRIMEGEVLGMRR